MNLTERVPNKLVGDELVESWDYKVNEKIPKVEPLGLQ